ncbi:MAG: hypothetical protein LBS87_01415 [Puniceicoccales bacterium]|jgi:hypothetical protein|nr:hypothetical protein [Puniceicoccales bacterium]
MSKPKLNAVDTPETAIHGRGKASRQRVKVVKRHELSFLGRPAIESGQVSRFLIEKTQLLGEKSIFKKILGALNSILSPLGTIGSAAGVMCAIGGIEFPPIAIIGVISTCLSLMSAVCNIASNVGRYDISKNRALYGQILGYAINILKAALSSAFPISNLMIFAIGATGTFTSIRSFYAELLSDYHNNRLDESYPKWVASLMKMYFKLSEK